MSAAPVRRWRRAAAAAVIGTVAAAPAWGHPGRPPEPHDVWSAWSFDPGVLLVIGVSAMVYARGVGRLWNRAGPGRGIPRWRFRCFAGGLAALFLALVSPLDAMGTALFSAHMVQHEVLMLLAAPLLVLGLPVIALLWALPIGWRRTLGRWAKGAVARRAFRSLTHPLTAWSLYALALWVWHMPALYQATLRSEWAHIAQHASFMGSAVLFWWVLLDPARVRRGEYGTSVLYVFTTAVHGSLLGALLTFARTPWYPAYAPTTPAWGLSPLDDQQLGGLLMWIPPGFLYLCIALAAAGVWLRAMENRKPPRSLDRPNLTRKDSDVAPHSA